MTLFPPVGAPGPTTAVLAITDTTAIGFYVFYAVIAITLVIWLARTLFKNGQVFLEDVFENERVAESINHLLVVGFYLLNLGYALLLYQVDAELDLSDAFNGLVARLGLLLLSLGAVHLFNMFVFWRIRNHRGRGRKYPAPRPIVPAQNPAPPMNPSPTSNTYVGMPAATPSYQGTAPGQTYSAADPSDLPPPMANGPTGR